jgi:prepilin-type N-terminal cleavage/methylation domain-containing protein
MNNTTSFRNRNRDAFTLIELLVVIGIIALLAALITGGAAIASSKMKRARVETERDALATAIDSYYKARGFYPAGNTNDTVQTPLYYELTGTVLDPVSQKFTAASLETFTPTVLNTLFGVSGFINCSNSETPSKNFYPGLKANQHEIVVGTGPNNYTVLGMAISGPLELAPAPGGTFQINPWHYVSANPTNNHDSYDLWMDVKYAGKTNRISNWSKEPQLVN